MKTLGPAHENVSSYIMGNFRQGDGVPAPASRLVRSVRFTCGLVWCVTGLVLAALVVRIVVRLVAGVDEYGGSSVPWISTVYNVTGLVANWLSSAGNVIIPINGMPHLLDVSSVLTIDVLFFATLAVTKIAMWAAARVGGRRQPQADMPQPSTHAVIEIETPIVDERPLEPVGAGSA